MIVRIKKFLAERLRWCKQNKLRAIVTFIISTIIFLFFCLGCLIWAVDKNFMGLFGESPTIEDMKSPIQMEASELYSEDGVLLGKYFVENRSSISYQELSDTIIKTLIYTEDERFYQHNGVDFQGMFSAVKDAIFGRARGASTISQQLIKNLYKMRSEYNDGKFCKTPVLGTLIVKIKECLGAMRLEKYYKKDEILTLYFNTVTFGNNTYGIKSAAKTYFNTTPNKLNYAQAASIVGILKANTYYNPVKNPENNKKRRNLILNILAEKNVIDNHLCDSLCETPIGLKLQTVKLDGSALYFKEAVLNELQEWCDNHNKDPYKDGLRIYTSLNSVMQKHAESAVKTQMAELQSKFFKHWKGANPWRGKNNGELKTFIDETLPKTEAYKALVSKYGKNKDSIRYYINRPHKMKIYDYGKGLKDTFMSSRDSLKYILKFMHCGLLAMDPHTGQVKAWVGDVDFRYWQYDKITAKRQPGSTFKLFVYAEALRQGYCSCDTRVDSSITWVHKDDDGVYRPWVPQNASGTFSEEPMTLKTAFARSVNSIAVQLTREVGTTKIIKLAEKMGIEGPIKNTPSICLGTEDASLIELVTAYSAVVDEGVKHKPILITRIESKDGKILYRNKGSKETVLDYETAFLMRDMLQEGLRDERGTSKRLYNYKIHGTTDFGGKTGTSANYSDAWYMSISPNLVTGVWVGGEYRCIHFRNGELGQGSRAALPIFGKFMEKVMADGRLKQYRGRFGGPRKSISKKYDCSDVDLEVKKEGKIKRWFKRLFGRDDDDEEEENNTEKVSKKEKKKKESVDKNKDEKKKSWRERRREKREKRKKERENRKNKR